MRRKLETDLSARHLGELLLDLRRMPVICDAVRSDGFRRLRVDQRNVSLSSGACDSRFGVDDDAVRIDQPLFAQQRGNRQYAGRRIAARVGHQARVFYLISPELRQSVDLFRDELSGRMLRLVPLFVDRRIVQTKIRAEIHELHAFFYSQPGDIEHQAVRQSRKHHVHFADRIHRFFRAEKLLIHDSAVLRVNVGKFLSCVGIGREKGHFRIRMIDEEAHQLLSRIACRPDHSSFYHCSSSPLSAFSAGGRPRSERLPS